MSHREQIEQVSSSDMDNSPFIISTVIRIGVWVSAAFIIVGLTMFLVTGDSGYPYETYPTTLTAIWSGLLAGKSYAIILTGLFLLILTPVFRIVTTLFLFWKQRDIIYVCIALILLFVLFISFVIGKTT
ncbi:putative membrane protein [Priestia taiwanensis]|uniref:Membrane protein n=2 Tax=Priestia taiwanensis TaxID=1347902 RepID=A0A917ESJ5_9BACI|nr:putative membrane protein [Priestia taiwanensis]GGE85459.1 membrane protein [Priestia taiwanensis]